MSERYYGICSSCNVNKLKGWNTKRCRPCWRLVAVAPNKGKKTGVPAWNRGLPSPLKGIPRDPEIGKRVSSTKLSRQFKHSDETKRKMSANRKGKRAGEAAHQWIHDRSKLKRYNDVSKDRRSYAYAFWRKSVWLRDNFKCKINNAECAGRIEAHHILGWAEYPELRYEINNGITLCHGHHPRKRNEEKRLSPYFQSLVINET